MHTIDLWRNEYPSTLPLRFFDQLKTAIKEEKIELEDPFSIVFAKSYSDLEPRDIFMIGSFFKINFDQLKNYFTHDDESLTTFGKFESLKLWKCKKTMAATAKEIKTTFKTKQEANLDADNLVNRQKEIILAALESHIDDSKLKYLIDNADTTKLRLLVNRGQWASWYQLLRFLGEISPEKTTYLINHSNIENLTSVIRGINIDNLIYLWENTRIENLSYLINSTWGNCNKLVAQLPPDDLVYFIDNVDIKNFSYFINNFYSDSVIRSELLFRDTEQTRLAYVLNNVNLDNFITIAKNTNLWNLSYIINKSIISEGITKDPVDWLDIEKVVSLIAHCEPLILSDIIALSDKETMLYYIENIRTFVLSELVNEANKENFLYVIANTQKEIFADWIKNSDKEKRDLIGLINLTEKEKLTTYINSGGAYPQGNTEAKDFALALNDNLFPKKSSKAK